MTKHKIHYYGDQRGGIFCTTAGASRSPQDLGALHRRTTNEPTSVTCCACIIGMKHTGILKSAKPSRLEDAAQAVIDAYQSRFETGTGNYFGPIDDEIKALRKALQR